MSDDNTTFDDFLSDKDKEEIKPPKPKPLEPIVGQQCARCRNTAKSLYYNEYLCEDCFTAEYDKMLKMYDDDRTAKQFGDEVDEYES